MSEATALRDSIEAEYRRRTPRSEAHHRRARESMPGGDTRTITTFAPYPTYMAKGQGCRLFDVDGNVYLDYLNNYTALVHGHAHPAITAAASAQLARGTAYAAPAENQYRLAEAIAARVASVEQVRFGNSGTEAVMSALRAAIAFTGRPSIVKMEGGYHGTHDLVEISVHPPLNAAGSDDRPLAVPEHRAVLKGAVENVLVVPFNNLAATEATLREHAPRIAAVIIEPVMGVAGMIPARREYLQMLRAVTQELGILLICDEVMTFRLSYGGAQEIYDVRPDLTTFAKAIGGGFPVGAFGGRQEVMDVFNPEKGGMSHSGTYNGNPMTMAAGLAALDLLTPQAIAGMNALGDRLRDGFRQAFVAAGIAGQVTGLGSLVNVHFTGQEVTDYRGGASSRPDLMGLLHLSLMNKGIFAAKRGMFNISTPMTKGDVDLAVAAFREALQEIKAAR